MAADFEAEIRNSLRSLTSQVTALSASVGKLQQQGRQVGQTLGSAFKGVTPAAKEAKKKADEFGKSIKGAGEALTKMGGPLAEVLGRLTGGAGLAGNLGRVAAAAALFGLAMRAGNAIVEAQLDRTNRLIEAQKQLADVKERARNAEGSQALGALSSQGPDIRALFTRGNAEAVEVANQISATGIDTPSSIRKGVAAAYTLSGHNEKETVIEAARRMAHMGEMGFGEAVNALIQDRGLLRTMMGTPDGPPSFNKGMERFILKSRGQPNTKANRDKASQDLQFAEGFADQGYYATIAETQGLLNRADTVAQQRLLLGQSAAPARDQLHAAQNPVAHEMLKLMREQLASQKRLEQLAAAQGTFGRVMSTLSPQGSYETQAIRSQNAQAAAHFGKDG